MDNKIKVQELDGPSQDLLSQLRGSMKFARFGETGYIMSATYTEDAEAFKNMVVRQDDLWVITFPRSGTTMTQELIWLLKNDFNYEEASKIPLFDRYLYLGIKQLGNPKVVKYVTSRMPSNEEIANMPAPRFIKTHVPLSLLPANLLDITKVVYIARDPRDVAVSLYHMFKLLNSFEGDFKTFWNLFNKDLVSYCPFFAHVKEAWALRHHPNMLFIFYEDLTKDIPSSIKKLSKFLGTEATDEQIAKLCEHVDINNFRKNQSVNPLGLIKDAGNPEAEGFIRKGKSGGWRDLFDEKMTAEASVWMQQNLADTDLRFPGTSP